MALREYYFNIWGFQNFTREKPKREEKITVNQAILFFNDAEEFNSTI